MRAKQEKTLDLCRQIVSDKNHISILEMSLTIQNSLDCSNIKSVFKNENATIAYSIMKILVVRFLDSFGFSTKHNETQIETITVDSLENFSYESIEDAVIFFKMARQGKFGTTNRGIDSNLIFGDYLPKYLDIKSIKREELHNREKQGAVNSVLTLDDVKKAYKIKSPQQQHDAIKKRINEITIGFSRQDLEDLIKLWQNDVVKKPFINHLKSKRLTIKK